MKRILLAGLVSFGGTAAVLAQSVTSINAVGYVNVTVPAGFSMIANQLLATDSKISTLIQSPAAGTQIFKFNGTGFEIYEFLGAPFNVWSPNGDATLQPGEGAFIKNPGASSVTITFVGEVPAGNLVNNLPSGFSIRSSQVPQSGAVTSQLQFPTAASDKIYRFNNAGNNYEIFEFLGAPFNVWSPSEPSVNVGESFFVFKSSTADWSRTFTIE